MITQEYQKTKDTQLILNGHNEDDDNGVMMQYDDGDGMIRWSIATRNIGV
jgi:hypothetical protein